MVRMMFICTHTRTTAAAAAARSATMVHGDTRVNGVNMIWFPLLRRGGRYRNQFLSNYIIAVPGITGYACVRGICLRQRGRVVCLLCACCHEYYISFSCLLLPLLGRGRGVDLDGQGVRPRGLFCACVGQHIRNLRIAGLYAKHCNA